MPVAVTIQTASNGSTDSAYDILTKIQTGFDDVCTALNDLATAVGVALGGDSAQTIEGSSSSPILTLKQAGTGPALAVVSSGDLETMTVTPDGVTTIGDKPTAGLFEDGSQVVVVGGVSALRALLLGAVGDDDQGFELALFKSRGVDPDTRDSVALDDSLGRIVWRADAGASTEEAAAITAEVDGTILESAEIDTIVRATNIVTVTTKTAHNASPGIDVAIEGVTKESFNGVFNVNTTPTSTTFTFAQAAADDSDNTGIMALRNMPSRLVFYGRRTGYSFTEEFLRIGSDRVMALQAGIKFPATQVSSSDVNTLDDYEEGSFTPRIDGSTTAGTGTYVSRDGRYTKVGNRVTAHGYIEWTAHTGAGSMRIANLPFTSLAGGSGGVETAGSLAFSALTYTSPPMLRMLAGQSFAYLTQAASNAASSTIAIEAAATLIFSITYEVAT